MGPYKRYDRFKGDALILRDQLAIDRTKLANDRTLFSVIHLSLVLLVSGVSIIHFFGGGWWYVIGLALAGSSPVVCILGFLRHRRIHADIVYATERLSDDQRQPQE